MPDATWEEVVHAATIKHVDLHASCLYKSGDIPNYDVNAACVVEIEIDVLTGEKQIIRCDILEDAGKSLNPQVDIGQIEGAYVMGLGYYLTEQIVFDPDTGKLLTDRTWTYKPPGAKDIPIDFRITLLKNAGNPGGVFRSKATGEPAINLSVNATFAIRRALESARKDAGSTEEWFTLKNPVTCERVWLEGSTAMKDMII
ncbi:indole-3-acetaldehyde oxidase [Nilaparvata lugens]|uniref:indole-3-acetaldehyde oxidase n=1 Tax=Nilaparvata lugens TaxID=108931 RepID=UPI00193E94F2|nr:indole-3-acetaldehyde oxidase [Nilaparvata lugens]